MDVFTRFLTEKKHLISASWGIFSISRVGFTQQRFHGVSFFG